MNEAHVDCNNFHKNDDHNVDSNSERNQITGEAILSIKSFNRFIHFYAYLVKVSNSVFSSLFCSTNIRKQIDIHDKRDPKNLLSSIQIHRRRLRNENYHWRYYQFQSNLYLNQKFTIQSSKREKMDDRSREI